MIINAIEDEEQKSIKVHTVDIATCRRTIDYPDFSYDTKTDISGVLTSGMLSPSDGWFTKEHTLTFKIYFTALNYSTGGGWRADFTVCGEPEIS